MTEIKNSSIQGPLDWDLIKSFHCRAPDFTLPRTLQVINQYQNHINNFKQINKTIGQYLKETFFKNGESYQIESNLFPYHLENNKKYYIEHYIIWFNEKLEINEIVNHPIPIIDKIIKEFINKTLVNNLLTINQSNDNIDYIYFENSLKNKSVPEIRHIHLFIKINKS